MNTQWRIELFGGLRVASGERVITRFRRHKTGALLAYLACFRHRSYPREVLFELLWPECDPNAGRHNLNVALSSLRHQLQPPGVPPGAVIVADRASVRLNPAAVTTDVAEFEAAIQSASRAQSSTERIQRLTDAVERYRGALLPDYYENWILFEQQRLSESFFEALRELLIHLTQAGEVNRALGYALRGVSVDPLREEAHRDLMRLYVAVGQPDAALRQYHELEHILKETFGDAPDAKPTAATRELARQISNQ
jgi:DNA-binding SARP family transcriptional activator